MKSIFPAAAILAFIAAPAQSPSQDSLAIPHPEIAATVGPKDAFPPVHATYANGVRAIPEVRYWTPNGYRPLTMDVYLPPEAWPSQRPASR